jgi:hypothetical protein
MIRHLQPPQLHEVKAAGRSRFYVIESLITDAGYTVRVLRNDDQKVIWTCAVTFETAFDVEHYHANVIQEMISVAKSDLDNEHIK